MNRVELRSNVRLEAAPRQCRMRRDAMQKQHVWLNRIAKKVRRLGGSGEDGFEPVHGLRQTVGSAGEAEPQVAFAQPEPDQLVAAGSAPEREDRSCQCPLSE